MNPSAAKKQTFLGIQALRGIAACMVVTVHTASMWWVDFGTKQTQIAWNAGSAGVDIFFIISGFVMATSVSGERSPSAGEFLARRVVRIFPLYWLVTLLTLLKLRLTGLYPQLGSANSDVRTPLGYVLASLFVIPHRSPGGFIHPLVASGWTLSFEMFFYLLFAAALAVKIPPLRLLTPVLVTISAISFIPHSQWPAISDLLNPILLEFLAGVWLGYAVRGGLRVKVPVAAALGVAGMMVIGLAPTPSIPLRPLEWGSGALLLVLAAVALEGRYGRKIPAWLLRMGDASYSLYLIHALVILAVARVFLRLHVQPSLLQFASLTLPAAILTSLALYRSVERPLTLAAGRWTGWGAPQVVKGIGEEAAQH